MLFITRWAQSARAGGARWGLHRFQPISHPFGIRFRPGSGAVTRFLFALTADAVSKDQAAPYIQLE
ncbi:hypothetical protein [Bradyrhizobium sp. NAS80.1]|uniref:hypothetical protein n=1 Tax=Bradyrhizobium sp. NAS80.1 TaxID=1680159 RepID=UPI0011614495|nr:hypothetical protein [Bradyrhizobium sp. NAS80.1]